MYSNRLSPLLLVHLRKIRCGIPISSIQINVSTEEGIISFLGISTTITLRTHLSLVLLKNRSLPWDVTTPFGYCGEILYHLISGESYLFGNGMIILLYIAICLHHRAFYEMFEYSLHEFDTNTNPKVFLSDLIEFHTAKRFVLC